MYLVRPDASAPPYRVFCDQNTQKGGEGAWLVQRHALACPHAALLSFQAGSSSRAGWMAAWTSAAAGTSIAVVSVTLRLTLGKVTAILPVRPAHAPLAASAPPLIAVCHVTGEFWLGNDRISQLTKMGPTEVLIEMQDWTGAKVGRRRLVAHPLLY